jgi:hypothetical protein
MGIVRVGVGVAVMGGACLLVAACDPMGGPTYRYVVANACDVPIRADANGIGGVERIPRVADQPLLAPGESHRMADSFVEVQTIYVSVSRETAEHTEHIYPFELTSLTPTPSAQDPNRAVYTFVIKGDMCPTG